MNSGKTISSKKATNKSEVTASPKQEAENLANSPDCGSVGSEEIVPPDEIHRMIAMAAYCRAECRGFVGGSELEDWLAAEAEVKSLLGIK